MRTSSAYAHKALILVLPVLGWQHDWLACIMHCIACMHAWRAAPAGALACQFHRPRLHTRTGIPRNRGTQSTSGDNFYQLLGIESDASEDEVKAAYRRVAKELHPDVNQAEDANTAFMVRACS